MKDFDVRYVVSTYCSIARLKVSRYPESSQNTGTHVFGAQQLAVLYWAESSINFDIEKVIEMLVFHVNRKITMYENMRNLCVEFFENQTREAQLAHFFIYIENLIQSYDLLKVYRQEVKSIKSKYYVASNEAKISDSDYANLCDDLVKWRDLVNFNIVIEPLLTKLSHEFHNFSPDIEVWNRIFARYCILSELKDKVRKGPIYWNVKSSHYEVVAEHVFGVQSIAWLMGQHQNDNTNVHKVVMMMAIHETEESIMPDFTPYDPVAPERMIEMGRKAVNVVFGGLKRYEVLNSLLDEFNARQTRDGIFAHFCDKLEFNFTIKTYSDMKLCTIEGGNEIVLSDPEIQQNIKKGAKTVADLVAMHEMPKFRGTNFEKVLRYLQVYNTNR